MPGVRKTVSVPAVMSVRNVLAYMNPYDTMK